MSEKNINQIIRKNQRYLFGVILLGISICLAVVYGFNKLVNPANKDIPVYEDDEDKVLEPDLTGAISNTFDGKVSSQVITDAQTESKENREALKKVMDELKSMKEDIRKDKEEVKNKLSEISKTQEDLFDEMNSVRESSFVENAPIIENESSVKREKMDFSVNVPNQNYQQNKGVVSLSDIESNKEKTALFKRTVFQRKKTSSSNSSSRFYIPSGAFSNAIILEGADASAAVTASSNSVVPMQFKLTGELHLPGNKKKGTLQGCFVTAGVYGDISSERAIVRTERLSCVINGKHIDQEVKGHVAFYGKNGIKGIPVMRNGKILSLAFFSGALGGVGNAVSQIGNTQAGLGATRTIGADEVLRQSAGGGVSTAANKLADYYIQRAEQYHAVIPIGAANRVEVIFQQGFWAEFVEDKEESLEPVTEDQSSKQEKNNALNGLPEELKRQLGEVKNQTLNDFITPNQR